MMPAPMRRAGRLACMAAALALAGCAQGPGGNQAVLATPPPDGTACFASARVPFYDVSNRALAADQQQANANATNQGIAAIGAVATIAGLAAGGRAGNIVAAVGALTAVVGALYSNVQTDQRFIADVSYSFSNLVQCRQGEAQQVRLDVRAKRLRPDEGRDRLVALRNLMQDDADAARRVNAALSRRNQTYALSASDMDTRLARETDYSARQKQGVQVAQARQTIQSNQRALTDQVSVIDRAAQTIVVSSIDPPPTRVKEA